MLLYHGSIDQVIKPEIRKPQRTLDYGSGFYTTSSFEQAERWVRRKLVEKKVCLGYVNIYELNQDSIQSLRFLSFPKPDEKWIDFVMANRMQEGFSHDYDIVCGPVANDHVYAAFALYEGRVISKQALINELRTYVLVDQYLFHTEQSLRLLHFLEAKEIKL